MKAVAESKVVSEDIDAGDYGSVTDPVKMYLREMGMVTLLSREGEVEIAKKIEAGEQEVLRALLEATTGVEAIIELGEKIESGALAAQACAAGHRRGRHLQRRGGSNRKIPRNHPPDQGPPSAEPRPSREGLRRRTATAEEQRKAKRNLQRLISRDLRPAQGLAAGSQRDRGHRGQDPRRRSSGSRRWPRRSARCADKFGASVKDLRDHLTVPRPPS
ncbi:MAG: hypothetical protein MZV70_37745 [Desulfobacterales bacterium]|nr:hypothetical protein [Desulfobacterales bacterium]